VTELHAGRFGWVAGASLSVAAAGLSNEGYHRARLATLTTLSHVVETASDCAAGVA
jgi:hypothetical protein